MGLHAKPVRELVRVFNEENRGVLDALEQATPALTTLIESAEPGFLKGGRLVYIGAGTSGRLGVLDASEAPPTFQVSPGRVVGIIAGGDGALRKSSEHMEDDPNGAEKELRALSLTDNDTIIGLAAGGTTPYPRGALAIAKSVAKNCVTAFITCSEVSPPESCDHFVVLPTGPEPLTGSTRMKAGTATKLALNTISTALMIRAGRVYENLMVDLRATNDKLKDRAARIVSTLTDLDREAAFDLLNQAGGETKTAIVMGRLGIDAEAARGALDEASGRLDQILGNQHSEGPSS